MESIGAQGIREGAATLAVAARRLNSASGVSAPFTLAFLTDHARAPNPASVAAALPAGAAVIFRDYDAPDRPAVARLLRAICAEHCVLFLVGGDPALAHEIGADGVHLRADQLASARPGLPLVSASCHSALELERAAALGADLALLGPVFRTASHPGAPALGAPAFKALAKQAALPVLALGGVDEETALLLAGPNVAGLAAIGAFLSSSKS